jgi:hypothetical protein
MTPFALPLQLIGPIKQTAAGSEELVLPERWTDLHGLICFELCQALVDDFLVSSYDN